MFGFGLGRKKILYRKESNAVAFIYIIFFFYLYNNSVISPKIEKNQNRKGFNLKAKALYFLFLLLFRFSEENVFFDIYSNLKTTSETNNSQNKSFKIYDKNNVLNCKTENLRHEFKTKIIICYPRRKDLFDSV